MVRPRQILRSGLSPTPKIRVRGKAYTIPEAYALAGEEHRRGNLQAVADIYSLILDKAPNLAEGHNNLAVVLQSLKQHEAALKHYDQAITLKPDYANAHFNRGTLLKLLRRRDDALASYDRAIALNPGHAEAHNNRGVVLQELKHYDDALAAYDRVIALNPNHAEAHNNRGIVLAGQGKMAEAEQMFLRASQLRPEFPDPLFNLANVHKYPSADAVEVDRIRALLHRPDVPPVDREHLHFSLGKIYDDSGHYKEAWRHFQQANQIRNDQVAYNRGLVERTTDAIIGVFNGEFLAKSFAHASPSRSPIFVVGMPRSGTTLLASLLSKHPAIAAAGELSTLQDFTLQLPGLIGTDIPYPEAARNLSAAAAEQIITGYEQRLRRDADASIVHVVDKNPLNFRHIGLISLLFPQARILHCTRQPLATCLSNYFQRFPLTMDYSFDLGNIGHFYREYAKLVAHWHAIPGLKLMDVSYEDLVLNTEATARKLLHFLEIGWDAACLEPHTTKYAVETASQWQVRQPIYQRSLEHWRHYESHLSPLIEMLSQG